MITGIYRQTSGKMFLEGGEYLPKIQIDANRHGISIIVQEMSTIEDLTVAENIFFGEESKFIKNGIINKKEMNRLAKKHLDAYGFTRIDPARDISAYTFEERKLIELVKATYFSPKLLVVDETTTALSHDGREELFTVIRKLKEQGTAVIIISHDLQEVLDICDCITVLRDGQHIVSFDKTPEITENDLKTHMIGRELTGKYYREDTGKEISGEVVLAAQICRR